MSASSSSTSTSSVLVNVAEDAELRLIGLLVEAAPTGAGSMQAFQEQCSRCISGGDASGLLKAVIESSPSAINSLLSMSSTEEAVSAFTLLVALLQRAKKDEPEAEPALARGLADAVVDASLAAPPEGLTLPQLQLGMIVADRKVAMLSVLYNMRCLASEKCRLLEQMARLAGSQRQSQRLLHPDTVLGRLVSVNSVLETGAGPASGCVVVAAGSVAALATSQLVPPLVTLLDSWDVPPSERRALYSTLVDVFPPTDVRKQQYLLLLTETYTTTAVDEAGTKVARAAAIGAIRDPVSFYHQQRNMLNQAAIRSLATGPAEDVALFKLLQVFQEGKLTDYDTYMATHGESVNTLFPKWGLDPVKCERQMRILSLCSLAAEHEEIPYSEIAKTLRLPQPESNDCTTGNINSVVETWVIAAVNSGLLQAKMDQLQQKVMVERCIVVRSFDMNKWIALQTTLSTWKRNVGNIISQLKQHSATANGTSGTSTITA